MRLPATIVHIFGIVIALSFPFLARADNWERFRGPNGIGISNDKNIPITFGASENVRWKVKLDGTGNSSPIVWGDRVFLHLASPDATKRSLLCLDAKTGKQIWERGIAATKPNQKLRPDSSIASASPTTDGQAVYVPFWDGKNVVLVAYDFKGEKLWERNFGQFISQHGPGTSPIIYKDLVILPIDMDAYRDTDKKIGPVDNPSILYALNKKTGKTEWEQPRVGERACYSTPFLLEKPGGTELIVTSMTALTSYDPLTGKSNWFWTWTFPSARLRTVAATTLCNDMFLSCSGDGSGDRLMSAVTLKGTGSGARAEQVWSSKDFPYVTCPLVKGEHVYIVNDLGRAGCFVAKTGKKLWFETIPDARFYASPVMIDDKIYAASEKGDVFVIAVDSKEYRQLARNSLGKGEKIFATPAVANGALYIRTDKNLYCIAK